jgi:hypothetical protein
VTYICILLKEKEIKSMNDEKNDIKLLMNEREKLLILTVLKKYLKSIE